MSDDRAAPNGGARRSGSPTDLPRSPTAVRLAIVTFGGTSRATARLALVGLAFGLLACGADGGEPLRLCGDLAVPSDVDALRVSVLDETQASEHFSAVIELLECPAERLTQLPLDFEVPKITANSWLRVQGLAGGAEVLRVELRAGPDPDRARIAVALTRQCLGRACPVGQTCLDGACVIAPEAGDARLSCDGFAASGDGDASDGDASDGSEGLR